MPPKKQSLASAPPESDEPSMMSVDGGEPGGKGKKKQSDIGVAAESQLGIEEYMMPRMMTLRLAKGVLPPQTLIHKDAGTAMQYATSVFLNHIANAANEHTINASRKNISPQDILEGIKDTEWGFLIPQLEEELAIYVRSVNDKRNEYRRRLKERDSGIGVAGETPSKAGGQADDEEGEMEGDGGHQAKRVRLSEGNTTLDDSQMEDYMQEDDVQDEAEQDRDEEEGEEDDDDDDTEEQYGSAAEDLEPEDEDVENDRVQEDEDEDEEGDESD